MKTIGFIPLRSGSKGIINKNKKKILGKPLFTWVLGEAILSNLDQVYVFTDDDDIIQYVDLEYKWSAKVECIKRSEKNATDVSSTEDAMLEFSEMIENKYDNICLLQATSPLTSRNDINRAIELVNQKDYTSCISVVNTKRFIWNKQGESLNYDYRNRPRRQDFDGLLVENGAIYISKKDSFLESKIRLGGRIGMVEMEEDTYFEIDEPSDWIIAEGLAERNLRKKKEEISRIELLVLDVDGVFTDAKVAYTEHGEFTKSFSFKDGMGLEDLRLNGIDVLVMTSEKTKIVEKRLEKLKLSGILGVKDKFTRLETELAKKEIRRKNVAYIGDDINDLANICSVGLGVCPNDAVDEVKSKVDIILNNVGGNMAIREMSRILINHNRRF